MFVLCVLGHVDHGKSTLLRALTGMQTDSRRHERDRGMTVDLGYGAFTYSQGIAGVLDVPGHTKYAKNMVCGVGCADAFLFVVAADDGWMPQSEEHLCTAHALGLRQGIVVLTKTDLVTESTLTEREHQIREQFQRVMGSVPRLFHFHPDNANALHTVRAGLDAFLSNLPPQTAEKPARLWVDRVFNPRGKGVVVTGTLREGKAARGQVLHVWPTGSEAQVRSLQQHHTESTEIAPGSRAALQLTQVTLSEVHRGALLCAEPLFVTQSVDAKLHFYSKTIQKNRRAEIFWGTLEEPYVLVPLDASQGLFRIKFSRAVPLRFGEQFLVRLGGEPQALACGRVLDPHSSHRPHRKAVEKLQDATTEIASYLKLLSETQGVLNPAFVARSSTFPRREIQAVLENPDRYCVLGESQWMLTQLLEHGGKALTQHLGNTGGKTSLKSAKGHLKASGIPSPAIDSLLEWGTRKGLWKVEQGSVAFPTRPEASSLSAAEVSLVENLHAELFPLSLARILERNHKRETVFSAVKKGALVALADNHFMEKNRYEEFFARVKAYLQQKGGAPISEMKEVLLQASRKHMLLILEKMDQDRRTYLKNGVRYLFT